MLPERLPHLKELEDLRKSTIITYATSDRSGMETQIGDDILGIFADHLDAIGSVEKISLFLYTRGGSTLTAWSLVNLIRNFCENFEVIVPSKCHSSGTIICLGANNIVMTKQATLGPIDPSTNGLFNPYVDHNNQRIKAPVSVEHVNSFIEFVKTEFNISDQLALSNILINLSNHIHPIALGEVFKAKTQIQMIAKKLLNKQGINEAGAVDKIINFLASESGSHDYTIYRREARNELGLNIETPDENQYQLIKSVFRDIENELELTTPYNPNMYLAGTANFPYQFKRGLIESRKFGSNIFVSEGELQKQIIQQNTPSGVINNTIINDSRSFDGWKKA
jgi:hypothetical protein